MDNSTHEYIPRQAQGVEMINLCGKCGDLARDLDKHLGFHQYMLPGPLDTFILRNKGNLSLGVATGFNPLKDAKWIAPELYALPGLQDELVVPGGHRVRVLSMWQLNGEGVWKPAPHSTS